MTEVKKFEIYDKLSADTGIKRDIIHHVFLSYMHAVYLLTLGSLGDDGKFAHPVIIRVGRFGRIVPKTSKNIGKKARYVLDSMRTDIEAGRKLRV